MISRLKSLYLRILQNHLIMRITLIIFTALFCLTPNLNAQFADDMEWSQGNCPQHWLNSPPATCPEISSDYAHGGVQSGQIPNDTTTDNILDLGNKTAGEWGLEFWMFIPSADIGYFNLQGVIPVGSGEWIVGNFFFGEPDTGAVGNPSIPGFIDDTALGGVDFNFPFDEWFRIVINIDITNGIGASTWQFGVDGIEVVPAGTPFTNNAGTYPTSLGGMDFFSLDITTNFYMDDFQYMADFFTIDLAGVEDVNVISFSVYPNPVSSKLNISAQGKIQQVKIYGMDGNLLMESSAANDIDVSQLSAGLYLIEVEIGTTRSVQKFIKQ